MTEEHEIAVANFQALFGGRSRRQRDADDEWVAEKLHELFAAQKLLGETIDALAKRVQQLADRLDGQQRYGSPTTDLKNETPQQREKRLREHRVRNSPNAPSSMFRR